MKKGFVIFFVFSLITFLCACSTATEEKPELILNQANSWFNSFTVSGTQVQFHCTVSIENTTIQAQIVSLYGNFEEDVKEELVKEKMILGHRASDDTAATFEVLPGNNTYHVVFTGTFAGKDQKHDRLLPEITIVKVK